MSKRWRIPILLLGMILLLQIASCIPFADRYIEVMGTVYEWTNAPEDATSVIYISSYDKLEKIINDIIQDMEVVPITEANIQIGEKKDFTNNDCVNCYFNIFTDDDGEFREIKDAFIIPDTFQVMVTSAGYIKVTGELDTRDVGSHAIVAVLVKD